MKIVITGAADGLGREIANQLKEHELILIDYDEPRLKDIAKRIKANSYVCDLTKSAEITEVCRDILAKNTKIDILINFAGVWLDEQKESNLEQYRNMILVNLFSPIAMIQSLLPKFIKQKKGLIININSQAGVEKEEGSPVYGATKAGLDIYRKNVKRYFGKNGIKITDICPGMIETKLFEKAGVNISDKVFKDYSLTKAQVVAVIKFVIEQPSEILIPSVEIKNVHENL
jgi:short-subunit dehydrogenase